MVEYHSKSHALEFKVALNANGKTYKDTAFKVNLDGVDEKCIQVMIQLAKVIVAFQNGQTVDIGPSKVDPNEEQSEKETPSMLKVLSNRVAKIRGKVLVDKPPAEPKPNQTEASSESSPVDHS